MSRVLEGKAELTKLTKLRSNRVKQEELSEVKQDTRECDEKLDFIVYRKYTFLILHLFMNS